MDQRDVDKYLKRWKAIHCWAHWERIFCLKPRLQINCWQYAHPPSPCSVSGTEAEFKSFHPLKWRLLWFNMHTSQVSNFAAEIQSSTKAYLSLWREMCSKMYNKDLLKPIMHLQKMLVYPTQPILFFINSICTVWLKRLFAEPWHKWVPRLTLMHGKIFGKNHVIDLTCQVCQAPPGSKSLQVFFAHS